MRYLVVLFGVFLLFPLQSFAQDACGAYDEYGNCSDDPGAPAPAPAECASYDEDGNCADTEPAPPEEEPGDSSTYTGPVITENTPIIGQLAVGCFKLLSQQSSTIQWACEQAAEAAYQSCLDENDGYDTTGPNGFSICGSAHTGALQNCAAIPEVLSDLVTVCTEDDTTILQLYPF